MYAVEKGLKIKSISKDAVSYLTPLLKDLENVFEFFMRKNQN